MIVVRYHRAQVDDFIAIADNIEDSFPQVIVEGMENGDELNPGKIDIMLGDSPVCSVDSGSPSHEAIVEKVGKMLLNM